VFDSLKMANDDSIDKRTPLISKVSAGSGALGNPNGSGKYNPKIGPIQMILKVYCVSQELTFNKCL
jgi:hypothetical protein